jgi:hypothetical protein
MLGSWSLWRQRDKALGIGAAGCQGGHTVELLLKRHGANAHLQNRSKLSECSAGRADTVAMVLFYINEECDEDVKIPLQLSPAMGPKMEPPKSTDGSKV